MKLKKNNLQIAIDGPVAAGKSIAAYRLAQRLKILYVYTGSMYRAVAWLGLKNGLDLKKEKPLIRLLRQTELQLNKPTKKGRVCDVIVNGQDVTDKLFSQEIHWGSSLVGVFPKVRSHLVKLQRKIAQGQAVVMEGRDIASVVLPQADLKIYMTADLEIRAKRSLKAILARGEKTSLRKVKEETKKRDYQDTHRQADPLQKVVDAWVLDTTCLTIEEEVEKILDKLEEKGLIEK